MLLFAAKQMGIPGSSELGDLIRAELEASRRDREALENLLRPTGQYEGALALVLEMAEGSNHEEGDEYACEYCYAMIVVRLVLGYPGAWPQAKDKPGSSGGGCHD